MVRLARFGEMKRSGDKIAALTAYDAPTAGLLARAGVDLLLVGDSVGTNVLGYTSERDVTLADMLHHVAAVRRGAPDAAILADMPYATYDDPMQGVATGRELMAAGADMVKFEGARPDLVAALRQHGIPVSGHLGLEPQHHEEKRLKGKSAQDARALEADARALDAAGIGLLILELVPAEVAERITRQVKAPTIGIGAGRGTDGQVLVFHDAFGLNEAAFRHNHRFATLAKEAGDAAGEYCARVKAGRFPADDNLFRMAPTELAELEAVSR